MKTRFIIIILGVMICLTIGLLIFETKDTIIKTIGLNQDNSKSKILAGGEKDNSIIIKRTANTETIGDLKTNNYITKFYSVNKFRDNGTGDYVPSEDTINLSISKTGELQITDLVTKKVCYIIMNYSKVNPTSITNPDILIQKRIGE